MSCNKNKDLRWTHIHHEGRGKLCEEVLRTKKGRKWDEDPSGEVKRKVRDRPQSAGHKYSSPWSCDDQGDEYSSLPDLVTIPGINDTVLGGLLL
jgi:hypothetical protein